MNQRRVHSSWLLATASCGVLAGSHLVLYIAVQIPTVVLVAAVLGALVAFVRRTRLSVLVLLLAGLVLGLYVAGNELRAQSGLEQYIGEEVVISGRILEDPSLSIDGDQRVRLGSLFIGETTLAGELWVSSPDAVELKRSDQVEVAGLLSNGFGTIPAALYRARIQSVVRADYSDVGRDVRDSFSSGIRTAIDEPEASLSAGFLLGQKTTLPEKLQNELQLLGLTHIVVASGYNLTILVRFARKLFFRISRFSALALSGALVLGFAQITGFSPSMSRAALIAGLSLVAWYYGRKIHPFVLLPVSAAITVLIQPSYAWGDIGWLLSFCSFIGVIILAPLLHRYFWGNNDGNALRQVFIETLSAQILTLPIVLLAFEQYSPLALLANVLILPLIPIVMLLSFVAGIGGLVLSGVAPILGFPAELLLRYMTWLVDKLAALPQASGELQVSGAFVASFYIVLVGIMLFLWRRTGYRFADYSIVE